MGQFYVNQGLDPLGSVHIKAAVFTIFFAVILLNLGIILIILLGIYRKDNTTFKSLISTEGLHKRNRKNATTIIGHVAGSVIQVLGCVLVTIVNLSLGQFAVYFVTCFTVFFASVFQFIEIVVTPELRSYMFGQRNTSL